MYIPVFNASPYTHIPPHTPASPQGLGPKLALQDRTALPYPLRVPAPTTT